MSHKSSTKEVVRCKSVVSNKRHLSLLWREVRWYSKSCIYPLSKTFILASSTSSCERIRRRKKCKRRCIEKRWKKKEKKANWKRGSGNAGRKIKENEKQKKETRKRTYRVRSIDEPRCARLKIDMIIPASKQSTAWRTLISIFHTQIISHDPSPEYKSKKCHIVSRGESS